MKISYFEPDDTEYERSQPVKDEDGNWTTVGEQEDRELDEWDAVLDDDWDDDFDPGPDCVADAYERNLEYSMEDRI